MFPDIFGDVLAGLQKKFFLPILHILRLLTHFLQSASNLCDTLIYDYSHAVYTATKVPKARFVEVTPSVAAVLLTAAFLFVLASANQFVVCCVVLSTADFEIAH